MSARVKIGHRTPLKRCFAAYFHSGAHTRGGHLDHSVEKLLYSRRDTAEALCLSIRSVDYLITTGCLSTRRIGGKILIPTSAVRRFAREDHPESVRAAGVPTPSDVSLTRFAPQSETNDDEAPMRANGSR
jgi:hypothetical protein